MSKALADISFSLSNITNSSDKSAMKTALQGHIDTLQALCGRM